MIKCHQPVVVVRAQRWVRAVSVFAHTGSPINKLSRFRGSGFLDLLHFILSIGRILEIELNRAQDFIIHGALIIFGALLDGFKKPLLLLSGEAEICTNHVSILVPFWYPVKPQFQGVA